MPVKHNKLEIAYSAYLTSLSNGQTPLDRKSFLDKLVSDDDFRKSFGKDITRPLSLDDRLKIAYPDSEERVQTLIFLGTASVKRHLNHLRIPERKIGRKRKEVFKFINNKS